MLAKKREGSTGLQAETSIDISHEYHKIRYRPYRQSNSLSSKTLLDVNVADQPTEAYGPHSPIHYQQPQHQNYNCNSNNNTNNNNNNNDSMIQGNDQYSNYDHNHHYHHHHRRHRHQGSRLSRGSTHNIHDEYSSPAKIDLTRRERRTLNNTRSNSLFTHHKAQVQDLENAISTPPSTYIASNSTTTTSTPIAIPVSSHTAQTEISSSDYGSDRRKMLIQQRKNNGQFIGHGSIHASNDAQKVSLHSSQQHHFPVHYQHSHHYHSPNQSQQQNDNYQVAAGSSDYYTCHGIGSNGDNPCLSNQTTKGLKVALSLNKRGGKEQTTEKLRPSSCNSSRKCLSRNGSLTKGSSTDHGNHDNDSGPIRGEGRGIGGGGGGGGGEREGVGSKGIEDHMKHSARFERCRPQFSDNGTSVKVTDLTDPGGGDGGGGGGNCHNNNVYYHKDYHIQQKNDSIYRQKDDFDDRLPRTNGTLLASERHPIKEASHRGVNPLSLMKWEYEDLYGHMHKTSCDRSVRPKSAGVSARTHAAMLDSDDSSLDGDIEYVDLEDISDGDDAIVLTDSEVVAASSVLTNNKARLSKSRKEDSGGSGGGGAGIRRAYSMKDNQAKSFVGPNPRHMNKVSQAARRLHCNDSNDGKTGTKWLFSENKKLHAGRTYQKPSRQERESRLKVRDSAEPSSNSSNSYRRYTNVKKDIFDMSSFKDNLSFSQMDSLSEKCKRIGNGSVSFTVTGEQLTPEALRQLKSRQCTTDASEAQRKEKGEVVPRRIAHAPFPRRLKPLFGGKVVEDTDS